MSIGLVRLCGIIESPEYRAYIDREGDSFQPDIQELLNDAKAVVEQKYKRKPEPKYQ